MNELMLLVFPVRFFEVFVNTPLAVCEKRDVKGLYKKARAGSISQFTGVSHSYEIPASPDLVVTTEDLSVRESTHRLIELLENENIIPKNLRDIEVVSDGALDEGSRLDRHLNRKLFSSTDSRAVCGSAA